MEGAKQALKLGLQLRMNHQKVIVVGLLYEPEF